jgi:hypothetical protein
MITSPVEFRPLPAQRMPILFSLVVLAAFGLYVPQDHNLALWIRVLTPLGCGIGITLQLIFWRRSTLRGIFVDDQGIKQVGLLRNREIKWSQITHYRYLSVKQPAVAHGRGGAGLLGLVSGAMEERRVQREQAPNRYFGLGHIELYTATSAKPFRIGKDAFWGPRDGYVDLTELMEVVLEELHERLAAAAFAPFTIVDQTLHHANGSTIALSDIGRVNVASGRIGVSRRAAPGEWATSSMKTVDNSVLLLQQLAQRGVHIALSPDVFVPQSTLEAMSR